MRYSPIDLTPDWRTLVARCTPTERIYIDGIIELIREVWRQGGPTVSAGHAEALEDAITELDADGLPGAFISRAIGHEVALDDAQGEAR